MKSIILVSVMAVSAANASGISTKLEPFAEQYAGDMPVEQIVSQMLDDLKEVLDGDQWSVTMTVQMVKSSQVITSGLEGTPMPNLEHELASKNSAEGSSDVTIMVPFKRSMFASDQALLDEVAAMGEKLHTKAEARVQQCGQLPVTSEIELLRTNDGIDTQVTFHCLALSQDETIWRLKSVSEALKHTSP